MTAHTSFVLGNDDTVMVGCSHGWSKTWVLADEGSPSVDDIAAAWAAHVTEGKPHRLPGGPTWPEMKVSP